MNSVEERMDLIEDNVSRLQNVEVDSDDFYRFQGVKHTLQEAVEACIDIASRIIAEEGGSRGDSYSDYFKELERKEVICQELSLKLQDMAKFRNVVVHRYMEISEEEIQRIIDEDLGDLIRFIEEVDKYLN